ncbi:MAG: hypothetical protein NTX50_25215, partial [Candidatus Sumerlaeota bacterium]|nr:hypothetical protein [Candidatus Sumerlaeota bacterium]
MNYMKRIHEQVARLLQICNCIILAGFIVCSCSLLLAQDILLVLGERNRTALDKAKPYSSENLNKWKVGDSGWSFAKITEDEALHLIKTLPTLRDNDPQKEQMLRELISQGYLPDFQHQIDLLQIEIDRINQAPPEQQLIRLRVVNLLWSLLIERFREISHGGKILPDLFALTDEMKSASQACWSYIETRPTQN